MNAYIKIGEFASNLVDLCIIFAIRRPPEIRASTSRRTCNIHFTLYLLLEQFDVARGKIICIAKNWWVFIDSSIIIFHKFCFFCYSKLLLQDLVLLMHTAFHHVKQVLDAEGLSIAFLPRGYTWVAALSYASFYTCCLISEFRPRFSIANRCSCTDSRQRGAVSPPVCIREPATLIAHFIVYSQWLSPFFSR